MPQKTVTTAAGYRFAYSDEGSGPPVVLVHSSGMTAQQWRKLRALLPPTLRVIVPDLIGYGASDPIRAEPFVAADEVAGLAAVIEAVGEPVHLVGHSYSGFLCLMLARGGVALRSLTLCEPVLYGALWASGDPEGRADLGGMMADPTFLDPAYGGGDAWLRGFVDYWNGPGAWERLPEPGRAFMRSVGRKVFYEVSAVSDPALTDFERRVLFMTARGDNGAQIAVKVTVDAAAREAVIDFSGTSAQLPNNFNAPKAVTMAAVLYVFRTLVDDDIPLNAGCLKPLQVTVPEGCMLNPRPPAAVVAGNVETSMCVTNALFGALGVMAASQCTMNNFTFGNERHQYYETISGGSGAGPGFNGTSVVQTHMTNSRLTDPEVLEFRFPVRLESYAIRAGSGGAGQWRGGDGGTRRVRFLECAPGLQVALEEAVVAVEHGPRLRAVDDHQVDVLDVQQVE